MVLSVHGPLRTGKMAARIGASADWYELCQVLALLAPAASAPGFSSQKRLWSLGVGVHATKSEILHAFTISRPLRTQALKGSYAPTDSALVCPYRRYSSGARPARTGPRYAAGLYARALHTDVRSPGRSALVVEKSLVSRRLSRAACPSCMLSRNCSRKLVLRTRALPSVSKLLEPLKRSTGWPSATSRLVGVRRRSGKKGQPK